MDSYLTTKCGINLLDGVEETRFTDEWTDDGDDDG